MSATVHRLFPNPGGPLPPDTDLLPASHPIIDSLRALAQPLLVAQLRALFEGADDSLFAMSQRSGAGDEQRFAFDTMRRLRLELEEAVVQLDNDYDELTAAARRRLGSLYSAADYPVSLQGLFSVDWDFPSVEPPEYLRRLNPELYEHECERVRSRFDEAVRLAEAAFTDEFAQLISHLCERLNGEAGGRQKVFRNSAVDNLRDFFERFRSLNVGTNVELDRLVDQAQGIVSGVRPQSLRDNSGLRQEVATKLSGVQSVLDGLLVDRPRRNIIRKPR